MEPEPNSLTTECIAKLRSCTSLPTPPKVALQLIKLAQDPELDIDDIVKTIGIDLALTAKIMQRANSPLYAHQKNAKSLQKAIMLIGFNGVLSLALSFSLVKSLRRESGEGLDHSTFWRRALIAGSAGLALGQACKRQDLEELFVAAFIQDIGMLVLDQVEPTLYADPNLDQAVHQRVKEHEQEHFGATHAMVGSWLLSEWNFPVDLVNVTRASDDPILIPPDTEDRLFFQCVTLSGTIAELCMTQASDETILDISEHLETDFHLGPLAFLEIFKNIKILVQESEPLFEITSVGEEDPDTILKRAQQLMELRTVRLDNHISTLSAQV